MPSLRRTLTPLAAASATLLALAFAPQLATAASGPSTPQAQLVSEVPATGTPQVQNGSVLAFAQAGSTMVAGGSFTSVKNYSLSSTYSRSRIFAFDIASGTVSTSFVPSFNGDVNALLPGPTPGTVYVGGDFTTLNGATVPSVVLLDVATGKRVSTFAPGVFKNGVNTMARSGSQLLIGGGFTSIGGTARGGLASLDPSTGALTSYLTTAVSGNHNYGHVPPEQLAKAPFPGAVVAHGRTQVERLAVNPAGTRMAVVGNFHTVGGQDRDQIAVFNLSSSAAALDPNWKTTRYSDNCFWFTFDGYMRDVDFAPDGSYFTVAAAGGHDFIKSQASTLCDTVARWEANGSGQNVLPTWYQSSGSDSFFGTAVTGTAVYASGHPRFANNPLMSDGAGPGAVARPSLIALDPVSGMPLKWNPGREPRGYGVQTLMATSTGLWMGSDTQYWGNRQYSRNRLAFYPLAGGYTPAAATTAQLPARVYLATGGTTLAARSFDGTTAGSDQAVAGAFDFSSVRGATLIGNTLFYGGTDKLLHSRTFNSATGAFGPAQTVNPYSSSWDTVEDSGRGLNGTVLLKGVQPDLYGQLPNVTAMAFDPATRRLYYTLSGSSSLYYRAFSPDSGVVFPIAGKFDGPSMSSTKGLIISGGTLWFSNAAGVLQKAGLSASAGFTGAVTSVSGPAIDGKNWSAQTLFTGPA